MRAAKCELPGKARADLERGLNRSGSSRSQNSAMFSLAGRWQEHTISRINALRIPIDPSLIVIGSPSTSQKANESGIDIDCNTHWLQWYFPDSWPRTRTRHNQIFVLGTWHCPFFPPEVLHRTTAEYHANRQDWLAAAYLDGIHI